MMTPVNVQRGLRVDDILGREISIQWTEAVTLVAAACRVMIATSAPGFPAASQVVVCPDGTVVTLASFDQHPVRGAAHLLTSLLADDIPVKVRLMLSQATGTDVAYTTLKDFSDALAYFERPDPQLLLRALHDRAFAAPSRKDAGSEPRPSVGAPAPARPRQQQPRGVKTTRKWAIGATAAVVVLGLAWFLSPRLEELRVFAGVGASTPSETGSTTPAPEPDLKTVAALRRAPNALDRNKPSKTQSRNSNADGPLADLPMLTLPVGDDADPIPVVVGWARPLFVSPVAVNIAGQYAAMDREAGVYSRTDLDVVPPQSIYPKLPSDLPGASLSGRTMLDLLISADGLVEQVRVRTPPKNIHEFMLVSAAKAWRFDPALVHGRPVRFLHRVAIESLE